MATSNDELRNMIYSFRVSELQDLLGFAGRNKTGKKQELQARAIELLKIRSNPVQMKVAELHKRRFHVMNMVPGNSSSREPPLKVPALGSRVDGSHSLSSRASSVMSGGLGYPPPVNYPSAQSKPLLPTPGPSVGRVSYPIHPDVKLKPLPFYDVMATLLQPSSLSPTGNSSFQENLFQFTLSPSQVNHITMSRDLITPQNTIDFSVQIQLRFCLLETSCEQEDNFPPSICVKVNNKLCQLPNPIPTNRPGVEPKRPSRPVNITNLCKLSAVTNNVITVSWASEYSRAYAVSIYLVRRLDSATLLSRLRGKGMRNPDHTRAMIKEKLEQSPDSEIATTSLRGSLLCPVGKMKMQIPCRPITCTHLQCFDANLFIKMNEKKPRWICPVCDKPATFQSLSIDGLFSEISAKAPSHCTEVQFHEDGSWTPIMHEKEAHDVDGSFIVSSPVKKQMKKKQDIEVVDLTCDSDTDDEWFSGNADAFSKNAMSLYQSSSSSNSTAVPSLLYPTPKIPTTAPFISLPSPSSPSVISPFDGMGSSTPVTISGPSQSPVHTSLPYSPLPTPSHAMSAGQSSTKDSPGINRNMVNNSNSMYLRNYLDSNYDTNNSSPTQNDANLPMAVENQEIDLLALLPSIQDSEQIFGSLSTIMGNNPTTLRRNNATPDIISLD